MKNKLILVMFIVLFSLTSVIASQSDLGTRKAGECINLPQSCVTCTYCNITSIVHPNGDIDTLNVEMTKDGTSYNYLYCNTSTIGTPYIVNGIGDLDGTNTIFTYTFGTTTTGTGKTWIILLFLYSFAIIFLFASFVVDEESFVYLSGIFFLISGIYILINGLDFINISDLGIKAIGFSSIGIGMLLTIGAYIFNKFSLRESSEEEEE